MSAQCLSVCGPCKEICEACQKSYDNYVVNEQARAIQNARRLLEYYGFSVTPPVDQSAKG